MKYLKLRSFVIATAAISFSSSFAAAQSAGPERSTTVDVASARSCLAADAGTTGSALSCLPIAEVQTLFQSAPSYSPGAPKLLRLISAYSLSDELGRRIKAVKANGYLPAYLTLDDGTCLSLTAEYDRNARLDPAECNGQPSEAQSSVAQPSDKTLRFVGASWGYSAWLDRNGRSTIVTAPFSKTFEPLFIAQMPVSAIMAMNSPDAPMGNVTLVGRIHGKVAIVVLEASF